MTLPRGTDLPEPPATDFHDLDAYTALARVGGLVLSPDGTRLVVGVQGLDPDRKRFVRSLWEVDPAGQAPARRLTRSTQGEQAAAFAPDGTLLFTSRRSDPAATEAQDTTTSLWALPPGPGEARAVATRPGGVDSFAVARTVGTVVLTSSVLPGSGEAAEADTARRGARTEAGVDAILHESYPVRHWDSDLGPAAPRLLAGDLEPGTETHLTLRQVLGHTGHALRDTGIAVTPDGRTAVCTWNLAEGGGTSRSTLVAVDLATGATRTLASDPAHEYEQPRISPDGRWVAMQLYTRSTPDDPGDYQLAVLPLVADGADVETVSVGDRAEARVVTGDLDRWPGPPEWTPDGSALVFAADDDGRGPVLRVEVASCAVTRLTGDDAAYSDLQVSPDGDYVYALRSAVDSPPTPVRIGARASAQQPTMLLGPVPAPSLPGRLSEVRTAAADGTVVRGWLCLPAGASAADPAPLLVWIHGGPLASWNAWSWRWQPWLAVARGYAVLLPDPALSTGYGRDFVARGWGSWGSAPYTDLLDVTDAALTRDDVDPTRTAVMGGSFGGYLANWVAGHTDRFKAVVTHASLYALDQFAPTTDAAHYWGREMTPAMAAENSPHHSVAGWVTPTLVVHGDKDYRVPIGEALRLWWDLASKDTAADGTMPHKFLYYPSENHWILSPGNAKVWYQTVFAFLAHHVLDEDFVTPELLR